MLWLCAAAVLLPVALLALYAVCARWPWPAPLPQSLSLRGIQALLNADVRGTLLSSIGYSLGSALLSTLIALPAARAISFYNFAGKRAMRAVLLAPILLPSTAFFIGLQTLFTRLGIINTALGVMLAHIMVILPYPIWTLCDMMQSVGRTMEEQARTLGASPLRAFSAVSMPLLLPACVSVTALGFLISFGQYFLTLMIGGGRVKTFAMLVVPYIQSGDRMLSAAFSFAFILAAGTVYGVMDAVLRKHSGARPPTRGSLV
jgi:putative spermidine/putrescine transport system permease protein